MYLIQSKMINIKFSKLKMILFKFKTMKLIYFQNNKFTFFVKTVNHTSNKINIFH